VVNLTGGNVMYHMPRITKSGVDPSLTVTNSVTVNDNLILMANGEAGLYLAEINSGQIEILGYMDFNSTSANFVKSNNNAIFLASGSGGLKILEAVYYNPGTGNYLNIGGWNNQGVPNYLDPIRETIPPDLVTQLRNTLPNGRNLQQLSPQFFGDTVQTATLLTDSAEIWVTFLNEDAGWKNSMGFYSYQSGSAPTHPDSISNMTIIFPNVSFEGGGGGLRRGDRVCLGTFPAGTVIGYFLIAQGWNNGEVTSGLYTHFTDDNLNPVGQQNVYLYDPTREMFVLAFEDIRIGSRGCDMDYNDATFKITADPVSAVSMVGVAVMGP
jgi:hypothetical protein